MVEVTFAKQHNQRSPETQTSLPHSLHFLQAIQTSAESAKPEFVTLINRLVWVGWVKDRICFKTRLFGLYVV